MTIEIRGTNSINKGAQLMLEASAERLSGRFSISAAPMGTDYLVRSRLGLLQTLHDFRSPQLLTRAGNLVPGFVKQRYGLVSDSEIEGIVDASGFAYSDSFTLERIRREAEYGAGWRKRGLPIVLLPQALGPFTNTRSRPWYRQLLGQADLVFARDRTSAAYVRDLGVAKRVEVSPDFTMGLKAATTNRVVGADYAAIVPNAKMTASGSVSESQYRQILEDTVAAVRSEGLEPVVVAHERGDGAIAQRLRDATGAMVFAHDEPRVLKSVIGQANLVVGSRFHAIVGSLSQGVPTVTMGWSHKYEQLHEDFEVPEWVTNPTESPVQAISRVLGDRTGLDRVQVQKERLLALVEDMWLKTFDVLTP